jgi:plastocyanin
MRTKVLAAAALAALAAWACANTNPTSPSVPAGGAGGPVSIAILGVDGDQSFVPNPVDASRGSAIVFRNADGQAHRIVATDGSFDTGVIAPGASSPVIVLNTDGAHFYDATFTSMVGTINMASGFPPPCTGPHC